ncbi:MAG: DUF6125 family protein [Syntrophomonadaceae bacterium]|nr:DUF6125 family protein [Syntrophomonadaceae bacterium]
MSFKTRELEDFTREELLEYIGWMAQLWQVLDGVWFMAVEKAYGQETALEMDWQAWKHYSVSETKRLMKWLGLTPGGGIFALRQLLALRPQARLNPCEFIENGENELIYRIKSCRVQAARRRAGLPDHPCKRIGVTEYEELARVVDPRIRVSCLYCPPDSCPEDYACAWKFELVRQ